MVILESKRLEDLLKLGVGFVSLVLLNVISSSYFLRIDLTEEKRYSISQPTREMLNNLDETVYVEVYLDGDLPAGFRRLKTAIGETLEEFRIYSKNRVQFNFVNPDIAASAKSRDEYIMEIARKGIQPTDVFLTENGQNIQKRILPGAIVNYGIREKAVLLLKGAAGAPSEVRLNQSIEGVEYELASTIETLTKGDTEIIGLSRGHGELSDDDIVGLVDLLQEKYIVKYVTLNKQTDIGDLDLLMVIKPEEKFLSAEKYLMDQFIMNGGKVMFLLDALQASLDSTNITFPYDLDLDDMLFRYGVRINKDLVQDVFSARIRIVVGNLGDQPQVQMLQWPFFPLINTYGPHPIVRNLDATKLTFASSIDTVKADGIKKTPILFTSIYSRTTSAPIRIDLDELKKPLNPNMFNIPNIPVGYLLEGSFTSMFKNRPLPSGSSTNNFKESGVDSKILVIADGDVAGNEYNPQTGRPLPLGRDFYANHTFANADLLLNSIAYLLDDDGIIISRNKEIVLRPLDKVKIKSERAYWQYFNLLLPILLLVVFGIARNTFRKRKFASF